MVYKFIKKFLIQGFLISISISCLFPIVWMLSTSVKSRSEVYTNKSLIPKSIHLENFNTAWQTGKFNVYFFNTVFYTIVVVAGIVLVASLAAYGFARLNFPFKNIFYGCFLTILMIPLPGSFIPLYVLLVKLGIQNTRLGYILPLINAGLATSIFILRAFFEGIPKSLEDAARIDGCGKFQLYHKIALPLAKPALATISIFGVLSVWNEYILAVVILNRNELMPIQQGLFVFQGRYFTQYELLMAGSVITTLPLILIYLILNKQVIKGITSGAVKE
jgi:multiple sugar transport system permease protein/raffinose/stachyose/melibiose transport system permease protein